MSRPELFTVTAEHVALLRRAYVGWDDCEFGAPAINCKRPYGNGDVAGDIAEILGWPVDAEDGLTPEQATRASDLHAETETALQIFLATGTMKPGAYRLAEQYNCRSWVEVEVSR